MRLCALNTGTRLRCGAIGMLRKASAMSLPRRLHPLPANNIYFSRDDSSLIPLLTKLPMGKERWCILRTPPSAFGAKPSGEQSSGG
jgi:hypothetical protein